MSHRTLLSQVQSPTLLKEKDHSRFKIPINSKLTAEPRARLQIMSASDSPEDDSGYLASGSADNASSDTPAPPLHFRYQARREQLLKRQQRRQELRAVSLASSMECFDSADNHRRASRPSGTSSVGASDADDEGDVKRAVKDIDDLKDFVSQVDAARSLGIQRAKPIQTPGSRPGTEKKAPFPQAGTAYISSPHYLRVPDSSPNDKGTKGKEVHKQPREAGERAGQNDKDERASYGADSQSSGNLFHLSP